MNDFGMQDVYTLHIKKNRGGTKIVSPNCEACLNGFIHVNTLQVRQFTQTGKLPGVCKSCNAQFLKICRNQIRSMNQNENPSHVCDICGKTFTHAGNYLKHKRLHEAATLANMKAIEIMKKKLESSNDDSIISEAIEKDVTIKTENEKENNLISEGEKSDFIKVTQKPDPPYICNLCSKTFQKYGTYLNHCETHTSSSVLVCHICEKVCATKPMLKSHIARCESRQPVYMCHYCEKCFATKSSLKDHMKTHATTQETHVCKFCKEEFMVAEELEQHLLKHLNEHTNSQQKQQEKFNHFCVDCGKGFVNLGPLKNHIQTHARDVPFECKTCRKQFVQSHRLLKHLKTCKKEKSYVCQVCSKHFRYENSFKRHKMLHKAATRLRSARMASQHNLS